MRMSRVIYFGLVMLLSMLVLPMATTAQGNSEAAQACQKGGWQELARVESNTVAFIDQGECVSYAALGGTLVEIVDCTVATSWDGTTSLAGINLSGCDLSYANLSGAVLVSADLSGADLYGTDLSGADLIGTNLSGADLSFANLSFAVLIGANLSGANLYGVYWFNTTCPDGSYSGTFGTC